jgi:cytochrome c biogenesis protein CcmG/thiol:disulfide interchange protein DsbE
MKRVLLWTVLGAVLGLLTRAAPLAAADVYSDMGVVTPKTRVEAPEFTLQTLQKKNLRLADFRGKVVLLNFWATWCEPCRKEMPSMQKLWEEYKDRDFVILAVAGDRGVSLFSSMTRKNIAKFVDKLGLTYPVVWDSEGAVRSRYAVSSLPWTYLIGRDGKISGKVAGDRDWASPEARALIEHLLSQESE